MNHSLDKRMNENREKNGLEKLIELISFFH